MKNVVVLFVVYAVVNIKAFAADCENNKETVDEVYRLGHKLNRPDSQTEEDLKLNSPCAMLEINQSKLKLRAEKGTHPIQVLDHQTETHEQTFTMMPGKPAQNSTTCSTNGSTTGDNTGYRTIYDAKTQCTTTTTPATPPADFKYNTSKTTLFVTMPDGSKATLSCYREIAACPDLGPGIYEAGIDKRSVWLYVFSFDGPPKYNRDGTLQSRKIRTDRLKFRIAD